MAEPAHWDWQDAAGHKLAWGSAAKARVTADTASTLRAFARQGAGVALLPDWFVREDLANGSLIDALPALRFPPHAIYALYPHTRHVPKKTRCWVDFLKEYVRRHHASAGA
jgi:DNA-binding transcriptional LysR family regulator